MSQLNSRNYMEMLLVEYLSILRQQNTRQSNIIQSFIDSQQRNLDSVRSLLQRYLNKIIVKGYERFPKSYIKHFLKLKPNINFDIEDLNNKTKSINN